MSKPKCKRWPSAKCTAIKNKPDGTPYAFCEYHRKQNAKSAAAYLQRNGSPKGDRRRPRRNNPLGMHRFRGKGKDGSRQAVAAHLRRNPLIDYVGLRGWPDLFFVTKKGEVGFAEIKGHRDSLSPEQIRCHAALAAAGVVVQVWSPGAVDMLASFAVNEKKPPVREPFEFKEGQPTKAKAATQTA